MAIIRAEKPQDVLFPKPHDYLVQRARNWLVAGGGCRFAFAEFSTWFTRDIPDAIGFQENGLTVMVECKTSRSDFHADKRKASRQNGKPLAHYQYYLCEKGVIVPNDLDGLESGDWGLLWIKSSKAVSVKRYPKSHFYKKTEWGQDEKYAAAEDYARYVMESALFRAEKKGLIPWLNRAFSNPPTWNEMRRELKGIFIKGYAEPNYLGPI